MLRPSVVELLELWERGSGRPPAHQAALLAAAARPDGSPEAAASSSIGRRDDRLLALRERIFGSRLDATVACPACDDALELAFDVDDVRGGEAGPADPPATLSLDLHGIEVRFRLPTGLDAIAIAALGDVETARRALLERCLLAARRDGEPMTAAALPAPVADAVAARMAEADPDADIQLVLTCPSCAHAWIETFDIASFLWDELDAWATRTLDEVHTLASAYGWSEADVLGMSPRRRRHYLEVVGR